MRNKESETIKEVIPRVNSNKTRIEWIDITKGIAIFFVALGHVLYEGKVDTYVYTFHMPLFFMLSGMTFHIRNEETYRTFLWRKFKSLLIPYYLFGLISICIYCILGSFVSKNLSDVTNIGTQNFSFFHNLYNLLYGSDINFALKFNTSLWFLACLFTIENLAFFCFFLNRVVVKAHRSIFLVICLFLFLILRYSNEFYFHIFNLPMELHRAIRSLPFFLLGMLWQSHLSNSVVNFKHRLLFAGIALFCISTGMYYTFNPIFGVFRSLFLAFISGTGYIYLCRFIHRSSFLSYCGKNTLVILVLHKFPVLFFQTLLPWTIVPLKNNNLFVAVLVSLISILLCLVCGLLINRYCPFVLGRFNSSSKQMKV